MNYEEGNDCRFSVPLSSFKVQLFSRESVSNPGGQYSELAVLALRWAMAFRITGCGKTISAQRNFEGMHLWDKSRTPPRMLKKADQQGRSE